MLLLFCRNALTNFLNIEDARNTPVLILANKVDKTAISEETLKNALGIQHSTTGKGAGNLAGIERAMEIFLCSVVFKTGYMEGLDWISKYV